MKRAHVAVAVVGVLAASLLVPLQGAAAGPRDVICPQDTMSFTGAVRDLIVPAGGYCKVTDATITRDLVQQDGAGADVFTSTIGHDVVFGNFAGAGLFDSKVGHDVVAGGEESGALVSGTTIGHDFLATGEESGADMEAATIGHDVKLLGLGGGIHMERTTIGHDFLAVRPQTVQTGHNAPETPGGPVTVGNDFTVTGAPDLPFVFDGICSLNVGRDLSFTDRTVTLGFSIGGHCVQNGEQLDTVGRDLIVTGNHAASGVFGPSSLNVVGNHVGRDLVFRNNTAEPGGTLEVSGNAVGRDAACAGNDPAAVALTPNIVGRSNTCG